MAGLEGRLKLIQVGVGLVIGLLGTLIAGAFALYLQLGEVKTDVAVLKSNLGTIKEQQAKIEESLRSIETRALGSLSRIESRLAVNQPAPTPELKQDDPPPNLSAEEIATIKEVLKPRPTGKPTTVKVQDTPGGTIIPLPREIVEKFPRLKAFRYAIDEQSGAVLIVSNRTGRILEIIEPS
jgi:hypothetical protein